MGVEGRESPWTAEAGGVDGLDSAAGETAIGTGEQRFEGGSGGGAGEWHRLTVGLCVGVVRVRSGWDRATWMAVPQWEGKWKAGCCGCCGENMAEVVIILWMVGRGGTLMDLGCCCCCCVVGRALLGDAEGSRGCSALDLTSCRRSGSSPRANIVAVAIERETIASTKDTKEELASIDGRKIVFDEAVTGRPASKRKQKHGSQV